MTDFIDQHHTTRRAVTVVALLAVAVIHIADDIVGKWAEHPVVASLYVGLVAACVLVAERLIREGDHPSARDMKWWWAAGLIGLSAAGGYLLSRTFGLPGDHGADKGNWGEPLGITSLLVEAILVLLVLGHVTEQRRR